MRRKGSWTRICGSGGRKVWPPPLIFNFGMLYVVKYLDGTLEVLSQIAGRPVTQINILVPLGISYYIFQSCGYVIDCYRGKYAVEHNIGHYALSYRSFRRWYRGRSAGSATWAVS